MQNEKNIDQCEFPHYYYQTTGVNYRLEMPASVRHKRSTIITILENLRSHSLTEARNARLLLRLYIAQSAMEMVERTNVTVLG